MNFTELALYKLIIIIIIIIIIVIIHIIIINNNSTLCTNCSPFLLPQKLSVASKISRCQAI